MLEAVPEDQRHKAAAALAGAFDAADVLSVEPVTGGASGALTYKVGARGGDHLLRIETLAGPMRNPHQYTCMQLAADAGIAPPVRYVDGDAGVVVMPFLDAKPLADHPGGPIALATEAGTLLRRLHEIDGFPPRGDHLENLERMLGFLVQSGRVAPGLLDRHAEGFARIRAALPWDPSSFVSAHNDPNQFNVLSDGERLWLIDWETANRNDPMIDVATMSSHAAPTPELRDVLLRAWLGREPDAVLRARATLAHRLVELFAGSILLLIVVDPEQPTHTDLTAMTPAEFGAAIESGRFVAGQPKTTLAYAKIALASFADGFGTPEVEDALRVAAAG